MERTFILLKPDCVQRRLMGQVIARFEAKGLNFVAMKMLQKKLAAIASNSLPKTTTSGGPNRLVRTMSSGFVRRAKFSGATRSDEMDFRNHESETGLLTSW